MIVVADTGPLNYLAQLDLTDLIRLLYEHLLLPPEVMAELQHPGAPEAVQRWVRLLPSWVEVQASTSSVVAASLFMGAGERAAISLAIEVSADALLIDERKARHIAEREFHLVVTGTLGILRNAHRFGWINGVEAFRRLCEDTNFHHTPELRARFLDSLDWKSTCRFVFISPLGTLTP